MNAFEFYIQQNNFNILFDSISNEAKELAKLCFSNQMEDGTIIVNIEDALFCQELLNSK